MTSTTSPSRRERLRSATVAEIKAAARLLLRDGGPSAITLRAIARDMGMTAPAIYRYFPSLDALIAELTGDLYNEVRQAVEAARDAGPPGEPLTQLIDMGRAFRRWSLAHTAEFGLMFGNPVPGVGLFEEECIRLESAGLESPGARFGGAFLACFAELWATAPFPTPPADAAVRRLAGSFQPYGEAHFAELPIEVVYVYLSAWLRLYGLVAMEVFGHLSWALTDVEPLFEIELANFVRLLSPAAP